MRPGRQGEDQVKRREQKQDAAGRTPGTGTGDSDGGGVTGELDATAVPEGDTSQDAVPVTPETPRGTTAPQAVGPTERGVGPPLRILPLGSGLVLIGAGLALAFLGLRLRRT